jgi:hypothetical protein
MKSLIIAILFLISLVTSATIVSEYELSVVRALTNNSSNLSTCTNINNNTCHYLFYTLNATCSTIIDGNVPFNIFCCKLCKAAVATTTKSLNKSFSCMKNVNDNVCRSYLGLGIKCNNSTYIGGYSFNQFCCKSCNYAISTTTTTSRPCLDSTPKCVNWRIYCSLFASYNPHPCKKTCNVCNL